MATESGFVENWQNGKSLVECNRHMLTSKHASDVTFRVGKYGDTVQAHRYVLISRSHVFDAMLRGPLAEKGDITISDVEADVFSEMLRYLYTDGATVTPENGTGLLYLAKKYALGGLENLCLTFLEKNLTPENACLILEQAHMFDEKDLYNKAFKIVLQHGDRCFASESFKYLSRDCYVDVMRSDDLIILPKHAFKAAIVWAKAECGRKGREISPGNLRSILGDVVYRIPFTGMSKEFYVSNVVPRGILTDAENVKIMSCLLCSETDPSPFIRRPAKLSNSSLTAFVLYDGHKLFGHERTPKTRVCFDCSRDITLHSICLYGGGNGKRDYSTCEISRLKTGGACKEVKLLFSEVKMKSHQIQRYRLDTPVAIKANTDYCINVAMKEGSPGYVGDRERLKVIAGQYTLKRAHICEDGTTAYQYPFRRISFGSAKSHVNLIYALECIQTVQL